MLNSPKQKIILKLKRVSSRKYDIWRTHFTKDELNIIQSIIKHLDIFNYENFLEIRYCFINDISIQPTCPVCEKICKYNKQKRKYNIFCSLECRNSKAGKNIINKKRDFTVFNVYGVSNYSQTDLYKEQYRLTNLEKYGVENPFQSENIKKKIKDTNLEKFGVENPSQNVDIKNKKKNTSNINYGVDFYTQTGEYKIRARETNLEKYGVESYTQTDEYKIKTRKTHLRKYGVESYTQTDEYKIKTQKTHRNNYWEKFVNLLSKKYIVPLFDKEKYLDYDYDYTYKEFYCLRCNKKFKNKSLHVQSIVCPRHNYKSIFEIEIKNYLITQKNNIKIELNKRFSIDGKTRHEVDIFLPEYNVGIEYHGLYWHCDLNKSEKYHKEKYLFFKERGIGLIQIFESEWRQSQDIVKSIINAKLGLISNKIFARKCQIKEIDNQTYKEFSEQNHIQGYGIAKVRIGLFHNNELVQLASFSKPRFNKNYDWENIRTCTKLNTTVVGGFSKLMKYFTKNHIGSIITYVDCRYFNGGGYLKNGFKFIKHTEPNYFYFKNSNKPYLESRNKYQKHKLKDILPIFDETLTEYENMLNNKYLRIFDAGNLILIFE